MRIRQIPVGAIVPIPKPTIFEVSAFDHVQLIEKYSSHFGPQIIVFQVVDRIEGSRTVFASYKDSRFSRLAKGFKKKTPVSHRFPSQAVAQGFESMLGQRIGLKTPDIDDQIFLAELLSFSRSNFHISQIGLKRSRQELSRILILLTVKNDGTGAIKFHKAHDVAIVLLLGKSGSGQEENPGTYLPFHCHHGRRNAREGPQPARYGLMRIVPLLRLEFSLD